MPSTFIRLTNRLLQRVNDVEIAQADFESTRGIQSTAKSIVLDVVREINTHKTNWSFNACEHTQPLLAGVSEYAWPDSFTAADWNSFQIQKDINSQTFQILQTKTRDEWYRYDRDRDYEAIPNGIRRPDYCFPSHGEGFGVSPNPDKPYVIKFRYYRNPADMTTYDSETTIPDKFNYVILAGCLYHMNLFKENMEAADRAKTDYKEGINNMVNLLLPNETYVRSGRFNPGGSGYRTAGIWTGF